MTRRQLNQLEMYQAVLSHFDGFPAVWDQLAPIPPIVENLRKVVAEILTQSQLQAQYKTVGYTKRKAAHMFQIAELAFQLCLKLRPYARTINDHVLLEAVNYSHSMLGRGPGPLVLQRCQRIAQYARDLLPELATYRVSGEDIVALEQQLATTEPMTPDRDVVRSSRKTATGSIPELIRQARQQLVILDDLTKGMVDDAVFVSTYFNVRRINGRVGRREKVEEE